MILEQIKAHLEEESRQSKLAAAAKTAGDACKRCADALVANLDEGEKAIHEKWLAAFNAKNKPTS